MAHTDPTTTELRLDLVRALDRVERTDPARSARARMTLLARQRERDHGVLDDMGFRAALLLLLVDVDAERSPDLAGPEGPERPTAPVAPTR